MKRNVFVFVLLIAFEVTVYGQNASDFDYTESNGTITITFYKGTVKNVRIPETINGKPVVAIGRQAFAGTLSANFILLGMGLTSVIIPGSVKTIGENAFNGNKTMTSITLNNGITTIKDRAFHDCGLSGSLVIPDSVTFIGKYAFLYNNLISVTFGNGVIEIGSSAFSFNKQLTNITFGNGTTTIGRSAFHGDNLTIVNIPKNVTIIDDISPFGYNSSLIAINVDAAHPKYISVNGVLYNKTQTILIACPGGKTGAFTVPNGVTKIENTAFFGCKSLTNITIPDSVTSIGPVAFQACESLTSFIIPNSVTSISGDTFSHCRSLTSITIPASITSIDIWVFNGCTNLTSVTFQGRISSADLHADAFSKNGDLRAKYLAGGIGTYTTTAPVGDNSRWTKQ